MPKVGLVQPEHVGDGLYLTDEGYNIAISANHHLNKVAYIDTNDIERVIDYLNQVKKRIETNNS